jgi:hypothetical protein
MRADNREQRAEVEVLEVTIVHPFIRENRAQRVGTLASAGCCALMLVLHLFAGVSASGNAAPDRCR